VIGLIGVSEGVRVWQERRFRYLGILKRCFCPSAPGHEATAWPVNVFSAIRPRGPSSVYRGLNGCRT